MQENLGRPGVFLCQVPLPDIGQRQRRAAGGCRDARLEKHVAIDVIDDLVVPAAQHHRGTGSAGIDGAHPGLGTGQLLRMGDRRRKCVEVARTGGGENPKYTPHRLRHGQMHPLRDLAQHGANGIGHLGIWRQLQCHAQAACHIRVINASGRADRHQRQLGRETQAEHRRRSASTRCSAALQCHQRQQVRHLAGIGFVHLAGVVQTGLDQFLADGGNHLVDHVARRRHRIPLCPGPQTVEMAHLPGPDARTENRSVRAPVAGQAQHVGGIAGREAAVDDQPLALQAGDCLGQVAFLDVGAFNIDRTIGQPLPRSMFVVGQPCHHCRIRLQPLGEPYLAGMGCLTLLALEYRQYPRMFVCQQAQRNHTARPDHQAFAATETNLAVTTQADRIHLDRLDHRPPLADHRAVVAEFGLASAHDGDVGRGAAHVGDDGVRAATERTGTQHAGSGAGQNGADRALERAGDVDQRSIALHHHQRRLDTMLAQRLPHGRNQRRHIRDHARIERHRQRPPRCTQAGRQFMAAGDGLVAQ